MSSGIAEIAGAPERGVRPWPAKAIAIGAGIGGAGLFVWTIRQAGTADVVEGVQRVGVGILVIGVLGGIRGFARTIAWRLCLDREHQVPLPSMYAAYLAGDAIGNITPFGMLISEPSKIAMVRRRVAVPEAAAALAVENLFYLSTVVFMLTAGTAALLLAFPVPPAVRSASVAMLGITAVSTAVGWIVLTRRRVARRAVEWLIRRNVARARLEAALPRFQLAGDRISSFVERRRGVLLPVMALEAIFHATAVGEIWFAVGLITGTWPSLLMAFVLEYVNRTITVVFQFVPMWLGIDEAGTSFVTGLLQLGSATGVSLALVRKARNLVWTVIGAALLLARTSPLAARAATAPLKLERRPQSWIAR